MSSQFESFNSRLTISLRSPKTNRYRATVGSKIILLLFRYQTGTGILVINNGPPSSAIARLPLGNITVEVRISDSLGASIVQQLLVQVIIPQ